MPKPDEFKIRLITKYNSKLAEDIRGLVVQLSSNAESKNIFSYFKKIINLKTSDFFAAFNKEGRAVGMIILVYYPLIDGFDKGWIEAMVVDGNYRRRGIAESLMKKVLVRAKKKGIKSVNLTSRPERLAANNLYQKLGFRKLERNIYRMDL